MAHKFDLSMCHKKNTRKSCDLCNEIGATNRSKIKLVGVCHSIESLNRLMCLWVDDTINTIWPYGEYSVLMTCFILSIYIFLFPQDGHKP